MFKWNNPIFILGNPRSGTSLLRLMLDSHSAITIPPESHFFLWLEEKYGNWKSEYFESYISDLFNATKFETWEINKDELIEFLQMRKITSYAQITSLVYKYYSIKNKNKSVFWGDKNSLWPNKFEQINEYYPEAFYVHIIRDGRDVASSYKDLNQREYSSKYAPDLPNNIVDIANEWNSNVKKLNTFFNTLNKSRVIEVKYEDLIMKPEKTLIKILDILELQFEEGQLHYHKKPKSQIEPNLYFEWKEKLVKPPITENIGKFKSELSKNEVNSFNEVAFESLDKYDYL